MKFTRAFALPSINLSAYKKELHRKMSEAIAQGTMEWLDAVLREIPVWSGASKATFLKLAQEIDYGLDIAPVASDRTGQGMSQSDGEVVTDINKGLYTFQYGTTLPWLIWNEYHNANVEPDPTLFYRVWKEGPYMFQVKGADAFERFAETVKLPPVAPFVRRRRMK
jgi:hypothetical protein